MFFGTVFFLYSLRYLDHPLVVFKSGRLKLSAFIALSRVVPYKNMYLHSGLNDRPIEMTVSAFSDLIRTRCLQFEPTTEGKPALPLHQFAIVPPKFN